MKPACRCSLGTLLLLAALSSPAAAAEVRLHGDSRLRFATLQESRTVLGRRDRFIAALSPFDRQSRLQAEEEVSEREFLEFVAAQASQWQPAQIDKLLPLLESLQARLRQFQLPLPATVLLVQTTGKEEADAAHCRGNAIVLPSRVLQQSDRQLERLLIHELFHILSSHQRQLRCELYRLVGFHCCPPIELPDSLRHRKITNPDAPEIDCYIVLDIDGETLPAAPVLLASADKYDPQQGKSFFHYLQFRLLVVRQQADRWQPLLEDGQPLLLDPRPGPGGEELEPFFQQIGRNTNYIIHPEEILADNFVHLVLGTQPLPTPRIVEEMRPLLSGQPGNQPKESSEP